MTQHEHNWEPFRAIAKEGYSRAEYLVQTCGCGDARQIAIRTVETWDSEHPNYVEESEPES